MSPTREPATAPTDGSPRYAIVIATRNRGPQIVRLLESIRDTGAQSFEMVIVDQSSDSATRDAVAPFLVDHRIRYVASDRPGASRARNEGMASTTAPYIVITDDDCIVSTGWLPGITQRFDQDPGVGVVFCTVEPVIVDAPGHTPHVRFEANRTITSQREVWAAAHKGMALGAGMAIRRAALDDLGGFDEVLGPGARFPAAEDNDLAWRALGRGWSVYLTNDIAVIHDGFRTLAEVRELVARDFYGVGGTAAKYLRLRRWDVLRLLLAWLVEFGVVGPAKDALAGRRPRGLRRPYYLVKGVVDGLRAPFDVTTGCYISPSPSAERCVTPAGE